MRVSKVDGIFLFFSFNRSVPCEVGVKLTIYIVLIPIPTPHRHPRTRRPCYISVEERSEPPPTSPLASRLRADPIVYHLINRRRTRDIV